MDLQPVQRLLDMGTNEPCDPERKKLGIIWMDLELTRLGPLKCLRGNFLLKHSVNCSSMKCLKPLGFMLVVFTELNKQKQIARLEEVVSVFVISELNMQLLENDKTKTKQNY